MTAIFLDESGFTGRALLDPVQPHFAVVSSLIGDAEAEGILRSSFPNYQGSEFKFQKLWARPKSRAGLTHFVSLLANRSDEVFVYHIDKRFCVLTKLIDFLVEPVISRMGFDFYKNGYAPRFANLAHFGLIRHPQIYDDAIQAYYRFARDPNEAELSHLQKSLRKLLKKAPSELHALFGMAIEGADNFHHHSDINTFKDTFEIQLTSVLASVGYWRARLTDDFALYHDASNNFFGQEDMWNAITADDIPPNALPISNGTAVEFPLRVTSTEAVDSQGSSAIQLCDVIAGLAVKCLEPPDAEAAAFTVKLIDAGFGEMNIGGVRPHPDFPTGEPAPRDGPDAVDQLLAMIAPNLKKSK